VPLASSQERDNAIRRLHDKYESQVSGSGEDWLQEAYIVALDRRMSWPARSKLGIDCGIKLRRADTRPFGSLVLRRRYAAEWSGERDQTLKVAGPPLQNERPRHQHLNRPLSAAAKVSPHAGSLRRYEDDVDRGLACWTRGRSRGASTSSRPIAEAAGRISDLQGSAAARRRDSTQG
jgi:hypothetical protein